MSGFVAIGVREVSPDGRLLAYSVDTTGDEVYALRFRDLTDRCVTSPTRAPAQLLRRRVERRLAHVLLHRARRGSTARTRSGGTGSARRPRDDVLVFAEDDARYELTVRATRSGRVRRSSSRPAGTPARPG